LLPLTATLVEGKTAAAPQQVHLVKAGDTLSAIAQRHGLTVKELKRLNGLNSSQLKIGQKLALTRSTAPPAPQAAKTAGQPATRTATPADNGQADVYVVKSGDNLHTIARRHNLTVDTLKQRNGLASNNLKPGQRLILTGSTATPATTRRPEISPVDTHVVKPGDTLYAIARRHGMALDDLKRINDLSGSRLKVGQRLALASREPEPSPLLLPGDADENEVLELAYATATELEQAAFGFLSTPYRFGGNSRKGIDCSAFVQQVFREIDVDLPRSAREQFRVGTEIDREALQAGDLLFFRTYAKYPSHVGIYLGDGKMIHASSRSRRVVVTDIDYPYYRKRFIGAKRVSLLDDVADHGGDYDTITAVAAPVAGTTLASAANPAPNKTAAPAPQPDAPAPPN
jgi:peptidoglycan DL-endopeptidase LytE